MSSSLYSTSAALTNGWVTVGMGCRAADAGEAGVGAFGGSTGMGCAAGVGGEAGIGAAFGGSAGTGLGCAAAVVGEAGIGAVGGSAVAWVTPGIIDCG